ncbi:DUF4352 domain-containing protein [Jeotgalicoccus huakuii]|nr:DUF4352 domain-containing protein [Jeotgalicoccus huakuii]
MKKLLLFFVFTLFALTACGNEENTEATDTSEVSEETEDESSNSEEGKSDEIYEIGDTTQVESYEFDAKYEVTVNSLDQVKEYDGQPVEEVIINAPESVFLGVVNLTVKNISDEPIVIGEYVFPDIIESDREGGGEQFIFDFSEEDLNQELAVDEEATFDLVYSMDSELGSGGYYLKFENGMPTETTYSLPIK